MVHLECLTEQNNPPTSKKRRSERIQRQKLPGSSSLMDAMENDLWKKFPTDLFEAVVARLPVASFFRFRSVSRNWKSFLSSDNFCRQYSQVHQTQPLFYAIRQEKMENAAMYDPSLKKWHRLSSPSLPAWSTVPIYDPFASAGGLVCFFVIGYLYICNPLISSSRKLLYMSLTRDWSHTVLGITVNGNSADNGYRIIWLSTNGEHMVYDSISKAWVQPNPLPSNINLPLKLSIKTQTISIDNTVSFLRSYPDGIVSYNMVTGIWEQFEIPSPRELRSQALAESEGRILLVGLVEKNTTTSVLIWELQKMSLSWKETDAMPSEWGLEFCTKRVMMTCLGNKGVIMLSLRSGRMERLVTYNVATREWMKVCGCTSPPRRARQLIASGTGFYPSLTAST